MNNWTHAIVKRNQGDDDNDYAPRVTVFVFTSERNAKTFREYNRGLIGRLPILPQGSPNIPDIGAWGVRYEMPDWPAPERIAAEEASA